MQPLKEYVKKRDFKKTREPMGRFGKKLGKGGDSFVIQEHHASRLHYDFRLEVNGVLKSWSVPKGPSLDPKIKRLAVEVEDHPVEYGKFHGEIPEGEYGAGEVFIWDSGTWEPDGDAVASLKKGHLDFTLNGKRLHGKWTLIRTGMRGGGKPNWLLMKRTDEYVEAGHEAERIADYGSRRDRDEPPAKKPARAKAKARSGGSKSALKKTKSAKADDEEPAVTGFIKPQLALLVDRPPRGDEWIHETKYDGYRIQAHVRNGEVVLYTRTAQDWTGKYEPIVAALAKLKVKNAIFDGEMTWMKGSDSFDFQGLQNVTRTKNLKPLTYFIFDLLSLDGEDLRDLPLRKRKEKLEKILKTSRSSQIRYGGHFDGASEDFLEAACQLKLEGIVSKKVDEPYSSGRGETWLKSKCTRRQEFVIGGYTDPEGSRVGFGALLLGVYQDGKLRYAGRVGTGFDNGTLGDVLKKLKKLEKRESPFEANGPRGRGLHWVKPGLTCEIVFANWTDDGFLRVPVFHGLRDDKPAKQIHREHAVAPPEPEEKSVLTHPDKIIYDKEEITKREIDEYYDLVAEFMLAQIADRPLSLKRCPDGMEEQCFFQKHRTSRLPNTILSVPIHEKDGTKEEMAISSVRGLHDLVQIGAYEIHVWNCRRQNVMNPDQFVMDFDPAPDVPWSKVVAAAFELKDILDHLKMKSFLKVTGGKGLHVHVPVKPVYSWDQVKAFSQALAVEMAAQSPKTYTTKMVKTERHGKIFIDYLRNGYGATAVAPYSVRARPISAIAMPIEWTQLEKMKSSSFFTMKEALQWLKARRKDPWANYRESAQKIPILKEQ